MKKLCPNLDREDGLETVLEVPIPEEILTHKSGTTKAWHNMKNWMKPHAESRSNSTSMAAVFGGKNTEIQLLLGVVGAPLIPSPIASDNQPITRSIKDQHIVSNFSFTFFSVDNNSTRNIYTVNQVFTLLFSFNQNKSLHLNL